MKKIISIILVVLTVFSLTATMVFAEETSEKPIAVTFIDDNGSELSTIYVDYGEDYFNRAPKIKSYVHDGYKYSFGGWETTQPGFTGIIYTASLPPFQASDKITKITFKASYIVEEYTGETIIEDIIGENTVQIFQNIYQMIIGWIQQFILFLKNFIV